MEELVLGHLQRKKVCTHFACQHVFLLKIKSLYLSFELFRTTALIGDTKTSRQILQIKQKLKNPNWWKADKLAILHKGWRSRIWYQTQFNLVVGRMNLNPDYKSDAVNQYGTLPPLNTIICLVWCQLSTCDKGQEMTSNCAWMFVTGIFFL